MKNLLLLVLVLFSYWAKAQFPYDAGVCDSVTNRDFSYVVNGNTVTFTNLSSPPTTGGGYMFNLVYYYGDGTSSSAGIKTYALPGVYTVKAVYRLTKTSLPYTMCTDTITKYVTVTDYLCSSNSVNANVVTNHNVVTATNTSIEGVGFTNSYVWTYGDGTTSNLQTPPQHTYADGSYTFKVIQYSVAVNNPNNTCSDTFTKAITPKDWCATLVPNFNHIVQGGATVNTYSNMSTAGFNYVRFKYEYDDPSTTSDVRITTQNIVSAYYTYPADGVYNVKLTVTAYRTGNDTCYVTITKPVVINAYAYCNTINASFTTSVNANTVNFTNTSTNDTSYQTAMQYKWLFGDGTTSTLKNPEHYYAQAGVYNATLIALSNTLTNCADTITIPVQINAVQPPANQAQLNTIKDGVYAPRDYRSAASQIATTNIPDSSATYEFWYYYTGRPYGGAVFKPYSSAASAVEVYNNTATPINQLCISHQHEGNVVNCYQGIPVFEFCSWHHYAVEVSPQFIGPENNYLDHIAVSFYKDGIFKQSLNVSKFAMAELDLYLGGEVDFLDEFRVSAGLRYRGQNFIPPYSNYVSDDSTLALYHFNAEVDSLSPDGKNTYFFNEANGTYDLVSRTLTYSPFTINVPKPFRLDDLILSSNGSGSVDSICAGDTIIIRSTGHIPHITPANMFTLIDSTHIVANYADSTVTLHLVYSDPAGCMLLYDSLQIHVYPPVLADAGSLDTLCYGDTVQLQATGGVSYAWNNGNVLSSISIANPMAYPLADTKFICTITDVNGCIAKDSTTLTVLPLPIVAISGDSVICIGDTLSLTATLLPDGNYLWSEATLIPADSSHRLHLLPQQSTWVYVTYTNLQGCQGVDSIYVKVNALPAANAGIGDTLCGIASTTLQASGGVSYNWNNASLLSNASISNPIASPAQSTWFTCLVTDTNGCTAADSVLVVVSQSINLNVVSDTSVCNGDTLLATATAYVQGTYTWSAASVVPMANPYELSVAPAQSIWLSCVYTDTNGCAAVDSVLLHVSNAHANAGADVVVCYGDTAHLQAFGGVSYTWNNALMLSDNTIANPIASPLVSTMFIVALIDSNGCTGVDSVEVNVNLLPQLTASDTAVCSGQAALLLAQSNATIAWQGGYNTGDVVTPVQPLTSYVAIATDTNGCTAIDTAGITVNEPLFVQLPDTAACQGEAFIFELPAASAIVWTSSLLPQAVGTLQYAYTYTGNDTVFYIATDVNSCSYSSFFTVLNNNAEVWPGDANDDNVADNHDILQLGLGYGATGTSRTNASINWQAQCARLWSDTFATSTNYMHADCNGDGVINHDDTLAISLNYGSIHAKNEDDRSGEIDLRIYTDNATYLQGDVVSGYITIGDTGTVNSVYGLAFTFDAGIAAKPGSMQLNTQSSWITNGGSAIAFDKFDGNAIWYSAQTKIEHSNASGSGIVAAFTFIADSVITNNASLNVFDILMLNNTGDTVAVTSHSAQIGIDIVSGIGKADAGKLISIYPNPAKDLLHVVVSEDMLNGSLNIYNMQGGFVASGYISNHKNVLNISTLSSGVYVIAAQKNSIIHRQKLIIE